MARDRDMGSVKVIIRYRVMRNSSYVSYACTPPMCALWAARYRVMRNMCSGNRSQERRSPSHALARWTTHGTKIRLNVYDIGVRRSVMCMFVSVFICQLCMHPSHGCPMGRRDCRSVMCTRCACSACSYPCSYGNCAEGALGLRSSPLPESGSGSGSGLVGGLISTYTETYKGVASKDLSEGEKSEFGLLFGLEARLY